jgi:hypothetical protein
MTNSAVDTWPPFSSDWASKIDITSSPGWRLLCSARGVFDKSHNHEARSARRLVIEAVYQL